MRSVKIRSRNGNPVRPQVFYNESNVTGGDDYTDRFDSGRFETSYGVYGSTLPASLFASQADSRVAPDIYPQHAFRQMNSQSQAYSSEIPIHTSSTSRIVHIPSNDQDQMQFHQGSTSRGSSGSGSRSRKRSSQNQSVIRDGQIEYPKRSRRSGCNPKSSPSSTCSSSSCSRHKVTIPGQPNYNEIRANANGEESVYLDDIDYRPNDLLLSRANLKSVDFGNAGAYINEMTESSYTGYNAPVSQFKQMLIRKMVRSTMDESSGLFSNDEREYRPYEQQVEFKPSAARDRHTQQMARRVLSKYSNEDYV